MRAIATDNELIISKNKKLLADSKQDNFNVAHLSAKVIVQGKLSRIMIIISLLLMLASLCSALIFHSLALFHSTLFLAIGCPILLLMICAITFSIIDSHKWRKAVQASADFDIKYHSQFF